MINRFDNNSIYASKTFFLNQLHNSLTNLCFSSQLGGSTTHKYDLRDGGLLKEEVILRKSSENRHYTDGDGVRDSIVMGNLSGGFLDNLGKLSLINEIWYNASQGAAFGKNPWLTLASILLFFFSPLCHLSSLYTFFSPAVFSSCDGCLPTLSRHTLPWLGCLSGVSSFSQSTATSYSLSSRARTQSEDINDVLQNLDSVLLGEWTRKQPAMCQERVLWNRNILS